MIGHSLLHWDENLFTVSFSIISGIWFAFALHLLMALLLGHFFLIFISLIGKKINKKMTGIICFVIAVMFTGYGVINALYPQVKTIEIQLKNLPEAWRNKSIVHIADMHLGRIQGVGFINRLAIKINKLNPDIIAITGDMFDGIPKNMEELNIALSQFRSVHGTYYVLGNHDRRTGAEKLRDILKKSKITILANEVIVINNLMIIGITYPGISDFSEIKLPEKISIETLLDPDIPKLLLFHTPTNIYTKKEDEKTQRYKSYWQPDTSFTMNKKLGNVLQLSGHTHKGQIFPFNFLTHHRYNGYDYGLFHEGDFLLYVTNGVGNWGPMLRTFNTPEILLIKLRGNSDTRTN
ncbi:MAG: metallophosphoesterase [Desulfobacterales bacterium]|nr:metallophosphoesterase [Desulfobacterales bacterium]